MKPRAFAFPRIRNGFCKTGIQFGYGTNLRETSLLPFRQRPRNQAKNGAVVAILPRKPRIDLTFDERASRARHDGRRANPIGAARNRRTNPIRAKRKPTAGNGRFRKHSRRLSATGGLIRAQTRTSARSALSPKTSRSRRARAARPRRSRRLFPLRRRREWTFRSAKRFRRRSTETHRRAP